MQVRLGQGTYTYAWGGPDPLKIGDRVWLPSAKGGQPPVEAEIVALGSSYVGPLKPVLGLVS